MRWSRRVVWLSYGVFCDLVEMADVYCFQCLVCFASRGLLLL